MVQMVLRDMRLSFVRGPGRFPTGMLTLVAVRKIAS